MAKEPSFGIQPGILYSLTFYLRAHDEEFSYLSNYIGDTDEIKEQLEKAYEKEGLKLGDNPNNWVWELKKSLRDQQGWSPEGASQWLNLDIRIAERNAKRERKKSV